MDWNANMRSSFVTRPDNSSVAFLYNYNYDHFPSGMEQQAKYPTVSSDMEQQHMVIQGMDVNNSNYGNLDKKKRLTGDQLDCLENSFQEDIKLDPDRKMKLARELDLQPRQIAVWFQNRRARWKNKQLERMYDTLQHDYDIVCREKHKLQEEVIKLKAILRKQPISMKPMSICYTEALSGEETVESTSVAMRNSSRSTELQQRQNHHQIVEGNYMFNVVDGSDYNPVSGSLPIWGTTTITSTNGLPSYPN